MTLLLVILGENLLIPSPQGFSAPAPIPTLAEASRLVRLGDELLDLLGLQRAGLQQEEELLGEVMGRMEESRGLGP